MISPARFSVASLLVCLAGCGWGAPGDLTGKVTFNGKPLAMGQVVFIARDTLAYSGEIQENGEYSISQVPSGPAKIIVHSQNPAAFRKPARGEEGGRLAKIERPKGNPEKWFLIPSDFSEPDKSGLTYTVHPGPNTYDVVLTGDAPPKS